MKGFILILLCLISIKIYPQTKPGYFINKITWDPSAYPLKSLEKILLENQKFKENSIPINLHFYRLNERIQGEWIIESHYTIDKDLIQDEPLFEHKLIIKTSGKWEDKLFAKSIYPPLIRDLKAWWENNVWTNPKLANQVKVRFIEDRIGKEASDTLCYPLRKLKWEDFKNRIPPTSPHAGQILTNFEYSMKDSVIEGTIFVDLQIKTYMVKSQSAVHSDLESERVLNHEQKHFDIAYDISQKFKKAVQNKFLRPLWYESEIYWLFLEFNRELDFRQKLFDQE